MKRLKKKPRSPRKTPPTFNFSLIQIEIRQLQYNSSAEANCTLTDQGQAKNVVSQDQVSHPPLPPQTPGEKSHTFPLVIFTILFIPQLAKAIEWFVNNPIFQQLEISITPQDISIITEKVFDLLLPTLLRIIF